MKRGSRANNMAARTFKRGNLHHGPTHGPTTWPPVWLNEAVVITDRPCNAIAQLEFLVGTYCRAYRFYFSADFHQTKTILKRLISSLRMPQWKEAHGPTTWLPARLNEAVFITDQACNAIAQLEFLVGTYCRACLPYFSADFHQTKTILKRLISSLRMPQRKEAHGATTWPPVWLNEAVFITDRPCNAIAQLEFLVCAYCWVCRFFSRQSSSRTEHVMLCTIGILGGYLLSNLSVLFLGRFSSNKSSIGGTPQG